LNKPDSISPSSLCLSASDTPSKLPNYCLTWFVIYANIFTLGLSEFLASLSKALNACELYPVSLICFIHPALAGSFLKLSIICLAEAAAAEFAAEASMSLPL